MISASFYKFAIYQTKTLFLLYYLHFYARLSQEISNRMQCVSCLQLLLIVSFRSSFVLQSTPLARHHFFLFRLFLNLINCSVGCIAAFYPLVPLIVKNCQKVLQIPPILGRIQPAEILSKFKFIVMDNSRGFIQNLILEKYYFRPNLLKWKRFEHCIKI